MPRAVVGIPASLLLIALHTTALLAQEPPTFRAGIDLVQLDVVVLDQQRRPVKGLTADDFTVLENGKPRPIEAFAAITLPEPAAAGAAWAHNMAPDVVSNQRAEDGRLIAIMMDRSIPIEGPTITARNIALAAVDALGPDDMAAVVRSSRFSAEGFNQGFTADKGRLRASVESPFVGLVSPPSMTKEGLATAPPDLQSTGDCPCGMCVLEAIERVADAMALSPRRQKTLLFIGSAIVIQDKPMLSGVCGNLRRARENALRALDRANVTVHVLDPSGLETLAKGFDFGKDAKYTPATNLDRQAALGVLPDYTGGRTVLNTNAPESFVGEIFQETSSYYLLGFRRDDSGRKDERRDLRIRVNRDDVIVRSRRGYYPPDSAKVDPAPEDPLARAISPLLPVKDLPLELGLTSTFLPTGESAVSLELRLGAAPGADPGGSGSAPKVSGRGFEALVAVFDERARRIASSRESVESVASADGTVEWLSFFPMKPGRYEVRVGVAESGTGRTGSVYGYVDVPKPAAGEGFSVSGVTLEAAVPPSAEPAATLRRTFASSEAITARLTIHQGADSDRPIAVRTRVLDEKAHTVAGSATTVEPSGFSPAGVAEIRFDVPLSTLPPGRYLLTMEASRDGTPAQRRDVPFSVQ
jgi:VWFA-related protein